MQHERSTPRRSACRRTKLRPRLRVEDDIEGAPRGLEVAGSRRIGRSLALGPRAAAAVPLLFQRGASPLPPSGASVTAGTTPCRWRTIALYVDGKLA